MQDSVTILTAEVADGLAALSERDHRPTGIKHTIMYSPPGMTGAN